MNTDHTASPGSPDEAAHVTGAPIPPAASVPDFSGIDAVLFDLDGVLTPTAVVHQHAWERLFTPFLEQHAPERPYAAEDYFAYIDGKPRYEGVRSLLASRSIALPEGAPDDAAAADTVHGLGNRKNDAFMDVLRSEGVAPYPGSVLLLDALERAGTAVAVVSSSRNATQVLRASGLAPRFAVVVDGQGAADRGLAGKPAPDTYLAAAAQLGVAPSRCWVVEDAPSGVAAGAASGVACVIGVDRGAGAQELVDAGADVVVDDLAELVGIVDAHVRRREGGR